MPETYKITYRKLNPVTGREGKEETGHFITHEAAKAFAEDHVRKGRVNEQPTIEYSKI